eukprot:gene14065-4126_t
MAYIKKGTACADLDGDGDGGAFDVLKRLPSAGKYQPVPKIRLALFVQGWSRGGQADESPTTLWSPWRVAFYVFAVYCLSLHLHHGWTRANIALMPKEHRKNSAMLVGYGINAICLAFAAQVTVTYLDLI